MTEPEARDSAEMGPADTTGTRVWFEIRYDE